MTGRRKTYTARPAQVVSTTPVESSAEGGSTLILVHPKTGSESEVRFDRYLGQGFDGWVRASLRQLRVLAAGKTLSNETITAYACNGLHYFFQFMADTRQVWEPQDVKTAHMEWFADWLDAHPTLGASSARIVYSYLRSVMTAMSRRHLMPHPKTFMPRRQFKGAIGGGKAEPLSSVERDALVAALKKDILTLYRSPKDLSDAEALTVHALALSLRTGINTSPLLELTRGCLGKHPLLPKMGVLTIYKGRAHATQWIPLGNTGPIIEHVPVPIDAMALMTKLLERTAGLASEAPETLKNEIWLYRSNAQNRRGRLNKLTAGVFQWCVQAFVERHQLRGDDGRPMVLNNRRLRATLESRLWKLSNGDLITVAALMGQTPQVADRHYLVVTPDMRAQAAALSESLPGIYRTGARTDAAHPQPTPVASCDDPVAGDRAPKDGSSCVDFLSCLQCRSFAVVGTKEDLHRLFSFYWHLDRERERMRSSEWSEHLGRLMSLIDAFTLNKFDASLVAEAKASAKTQPIRFWAQYGQASREQSHVV